MITVGIVDDHPVVLGGLVAALSQQPGFVVAWSATTFAGAQESIAAVPVDVVLVDVRLADGSGLDLVDKASEGGPAFLVLSSFDRPQYARAALLKGAAGYLLKTAPMDEVAAAVRVAASGGATFESRHLASLTGAAGLTTRELEIIRLVADGFSNDEIAVRLSLSRKTVEAYLTRMFERWEVGTRTELALRAERDGWLDPSVDR